MARFDLTDFEWSVIQPLLPNKVRGVEFTSAAFTGVLIANEIKISMDGKLFRQTGPALLLMFMPRF